MIKTIVKSMLGERLAQKASALAARFRNAVILDRRLIDDIAEFDGVTRRQCLERLRTGLSSNAELWARTSPATPEEVLDFYRRSPHYIYELAWWHMTRKQRAFRKYVISLCKKGKILDWGGGIGILSMELARRGFSVTYADLQGKTADFAQWLFKKRGSLVDVKIIGRDGLDIYDTIVCLETIEHVPDPLATLALLRRHTAPGGRLIISGLMAQTEPSHPMHIARVSEADLAACGFTKIKDNEALVFRVS